jgi:hypothetical protein
MVPSLKESLTAPVTTGRERLIANQDLLQEICRRIVKPFGLAQVVPKCDCGHLARRLGRREDDLGLFG